MKKDMPQATGSVYEIMDADDGLSFEDLMYEGSRLGVLERLEFGRALERTPPSKKGLGSQET